jgi:hypothetical protein
MTIPIEQLLQRVADTGPDRYAAVAAMFADEGFEDLDPGEFELSDPEPFDKGIPTLTRNVYRPPTPMVAARFAFAGRWMEAETAWLGIADMEAVLGNEEVLEHIDSHRQHWTGSAPALFPTDRLTLFGVVEEEWENQTYLVWPERDGEEPSVWVYSGHSEHKHENLAKYLEWLLEDSSEE